MSSRASTGPARVALVTCARIPEPDVDEDLLLDALRRAGLAAELLAWDDRAARPARFDLCVLRSCWNYHLDPAAFLAWLDGAAAVTRLANPAPVVRANLHKRYLRRLETRGVPVVPTAWCERASPRENALSLDLRRLAQERGWKDVVVKPSVSAASFQTRRFRLDEARGMEEARAFLVALAAERDVMVQPYLASVEKTGERALVWIDGAWTHAVRKEPRFAEGVERVSPARPVSEAERALAEAALRAACESTAGAPSAAAPVTDPLLYARADVVEDDAGGLLLSELELIEPSLFLTQSPPALERLVQAIARLVGS